MISKDLDELSFRNQATPRSNHLWMGKADKSPSIASVNNIPLQKISKAQSEPIVKYTIHMLVCTLSMSKPQRNGRRCTEALARPAFKSVCSVATELSVIITIKDRNSNNRQGIFYKDDEDRFTQRYAYKVLKLKTTFQINI